MNYRDLYSDFVSAAQVLLRLGLTVSSVPSAHLSTAAEDS